MEFWENELPEMNMSLAKTASSETGYRGENTADRLYKAESFSPD